MLWVYILANVTNSVGGPAGSSFASTLGGAFDARNFDVSNYGFVEVTDVELPDPELFVQTTFCPCPFAFPFDVLIV